MTTQLDAEAAAALGGLQPRWQIADVADAEHLPGGYSNANWAFRYGGERYVLRVVRNGVPGAIARPLERELLLGPLAPLTAPVVAYALPEGHLLSHFVDGPLLAESDSSSAEVAAYVAQLHTRLPRFGRAHGLAPLIRRWLDLARESGAAIDPVWPRALARLTDPVTCLPSHNDLNPWNVIVRRGGPSVWCTLDWEWCGENDPLFDIVTLVRGLRWEETAEDDAIDRFVRALSLAQPSADDRWRTRVAFHLRECAWACAAQARFGPRNELEAQIRYNGAALARLMA